MRVRVVCDCDHVCVSGGMSTSGRIDGIEERRLPAAHRGVAGVASWIVADARAITGAKTLGHTRQIRMPYERVDHARRRPSVKMSGL